MNSEQEINRRQFLGTLTWAIGALLGAGFSIPAVVYVLGPALQKRETETWIPIATVSKLELGTPTLFKAKIERQTGWITSQEELSVYLLTENGRDFVAMSNICTHLGCRIRWIADEGKFYCPCHNGIFDRDGTVLGGPPPRPLDRFEVKVENDTLSILGA